MTDRQAYAFARPVHTPADVNADEFRRTKRLRDGVLLSILTVNR